MVFLARSPRRGVVSPTMTFDSSEPTVVMTSANGLASSCGPEAAERGARAGAGSAEAMNPIWLRFIKRAWWT